MYGCPPPLEVCPKYCGQRGCDSLEPFDKLLVKSTQPDESLTVVGRGQPGMTLIFSGSMCTPSLSIMYPQKGTRLWKNVDLSMQGNSWC